MCIEFPSRVIAVDAQGATIDREGRLRRASTLLLPDVAPGDWVYVAAGTIVERLRPDEAEHIRRTIREAMGPDASAAAMNLGDPAQPGGLR